MFGTIGRFRPTPGREDQIEALLEEWARTIRPRLPGLVVQLSGRPADRPGEIVALVLMRDEATYRELAARPEQDAWFRRLIEHLEAEPVWEDIAWGTFRADAGRPALDDRD